MRDANGYLDTHRFLQLSRMIQMPSRGCSGGESSTIYLVSCRVVDRTKLLKLAFRIDLRRALTQRADTQQLALFVNEAFGSQDGSGRTVKLTVPVPSN